MNKYVHIPSLEEAVESTAVVEDVPVTDEMIANADTVLADQEAVAELVTIAPGVEIELVEAAAQAADVTEAIQVMSITSDELADITAKAQEMLNNNTVTQESFGLLTNAISDQYQRLDISTESVGLESSGSLRVSLEATLKDVVAKAKEIWEGIKRAVVSALARFAAYFKELTNRTNRLAKAGKVLYAQAVKLSKAPTKAEISYTTTGLPLKDGDFGFTLVTKALEGVEAEVKSHSKKLLNTTPGDATASSIYFVATGGKKETVNTPNRSQIMALAAAVVDTADAVKKVEEASDEHAKVLTALIKTVDSELIKNAADKSDWVGTRAEMQKIKTTVNAELVKLSRYGYRAAKAGLTIAKAAVAAY